MSTPITNGPPTSLLNLDLSPSGSAVTEYVLDVLDPLIREVTLLNLV
jgi:hypothetical protein